tara:strand:- start:219 stop:1643 length:1425 start_codon:yes stop_codon:yes gene_type:complete
MDKSRFSEALRQGCVDPFYASLYHKDSPSPPAAPDYTGAALAQGAANVDTAKAQGRISNPNIYTPYGSQTVTWGGGQPVFNQGGYDTATKDYQTKLGAYNAAGGANQAQMIGPEYDQQANPGLVGAPGAAPDKQSFYSTPNADQPTINQTLSPASQQLLDAQNRISGNLANVAETGLSRVSSGFDKPFDQSSLNPIQTGVGANPDYTRNVNYDRLQRNIDTTGVQGIPTVDAAARQNSEDMAYRAATSRLDPQWQQRNAMQDTQLRNQGLVPGGEAYDAAKRDQGYQQNDAYLQAQSNAVNQGLQNQQAQFNMGLAANQAGFGQAQTQGNFANTAAGQEFGMGQSNAALGNQVGQQQFQQGLANANLGNQATQQQIQQQAYLRSLPLNELNALRTGSQVTNPQFQPYQGAQIGQTPIFSAAQAQGTANQNLYNVQQGAANSFNSGLMSMVGTAAGGAMAGPAGAAAGKYFFGGG